MAIDISTAKPSPAATQLSDIAGDDQPAAALGPGAVEFYHGLQWLSLTKSAKRPRRESWINHDDDRKWFKLVHFIWGLKWLILVDMGGVLW